MNRFRLGIIGTGKITESAHLPAALASPEIELVALIDPAKARAGRLAREYGLSPKIAASVEEVADAVDGVVIATPNHTHEPLAVQCINSGIAVLVEKPLAISVEEGERIAEAAKQKGVVAAVGYSTRFRDNTRLVKEVIENQTFGPVRSFAYQFGTVGGWGTYSSYIMDRSSAGGGVLVITGAHFLDRALYFFGTPDWTEFADDSCGGPEANACVRFFYDNTENLKGHAFFSKTTALAPGLVLETERGYVTLPETDTGSVTFRPHDDQTLEMTLQCRSESPYAPDADVFQRQLEDFVNSCRTGSDPMVTAEAGVESLKLIRQLYSVRKPMPDNWYGAGVMAEMTRCA
jgi:predicted dehydrogenase